MKLIDKVPAKSKISNQHYRAIRLYVQIDFWDKESIIKEVKGHSVTDIKNLIREAESTLKNELFEIKRAYICGVYKPRGCEYEEDFVDVKLEMRNREFSMR